MWSDKYYYLNIYKNESLSGEVSTDQLVDFLSNIPELNKLGKFEFGNREPFPYTQLLLLKANSLNGWSKNDTNSKKTNLITIVCSKGENIDFEALERVFVKVASYLNWSLIDEETDDGIENHIIWKPEEK